MLPKPKEYLVYYSYSGGFTLQHLITSVTPVSIRFVPFVSTDSQDTGCVDGSKPPCPYISGSMASLLAKWGVTSLHYTCSSISMLFLQRFTKNTAVVIIVFLACSLLPFKNCAFVRVYPAMFGWFRIHSMYCYDVNLFRDRWLGPPGVPRLICYVCNLHWLTLMHALCASCLGVGSVLGCTEIQPLVSKPSHSVWPRSLLAIDCAIHIFSFASKVFFAVVWCMHLFYHVYLRISIWAKCFQFFVMGMMLIRTAAGVSRCWP